MRSFFHRHSGIGITRIDELPAVRSRREYRITAVDVLILIIFIERAERTVALIFLHRERRTVLRTPTVMICRHARVIALALRRFKRMIDEQIVVERIRCVIDIFEKYAEQRIG